MSMLREEEAGVRRLFTALLNSILEDTTPFTVEEVLA